MTPQSDEVRASTISKPLPARFSRGFWRAVAVIMLPCLAVWAFIALVLATWWARA